MARKTKKKEEEILVKCLKCQEDKRALHFYVSYNPLHNGFLYWCKKCIREFVDVDDINSVKSILMQFDLPFIYDIWLISVEDKHETFGTYMKNIRMRQTRDYTWKDSVFQPTERYTDKAAKLDIENNKNKFIVTEEIVNRWGEGYENDEYRAFERKYNFLKDNYPQRTAMHSEALFNYVRYRVKEEKATSLGLVKEAKEWGNLAKDAATHAKINPSQLSKADLQDGLSTFGELARMVEQNIDIIPILPQYKEKPRDKVDFNIWCWANYVRDLKGLPLVEYKEIYRFYEQRKKEYENEFDFLKEPEESEDELIEEGEL